MNPQPGDSRETVEGTNEIGGTAISRHIWAFARLSCGAAVLADTSAPGPVLQRRGSSPSTVVATVISSGRTRVDAPSITAASTSAAPRIHPSRRCRSNASSRYTIITVPVSAATPATAIRPTQTAVDRL